MIKPHHIYFGWLLGPKQITVLCIPLMQYKPRKWSYVGATTMTIHIYNWTSGCCGFEASIQNFNLIVIPKEIWFTATHWTHRSQRCIDCNEVTRYFRKLFGIFLEMKAYICDPFLKIYVYSRNEWPWDWEPPTARDIYIISSLGIYKNTTAI